MSQPTTSTKNTAKTTSTKDRVNGVAPKPQPEVEVGVSAFLPFVTPYRNAWEALRDDDITVKQLVAMRRTDGQARALYRLITLPVRAALKTATFVPEGQTEGGEDEAAFIEQLFTLPSNVGGMTVPFHRIIAQLLMAIFDGFSAFELVFWSPKTGPLKGKWTLKKMAYRPSDTLTFLLDKHGDFAGLRQQTMFQGRYVDVTLEPETSVYWAVNEEERPFYGRSYFEAAFYHWDKKFKLYVICHLAAQRAAVGTRVGTLPPNPGRAERTAFSQALSDLGVAQYMTVPDGFKVESLREAGDFDFLAYINHHNSQMSKSVLAGFFDKEQGGGDSGKLVDFGTQSDALFMLMLDTIMGEIEEFINQKIIPRFIDWNFGSSKYPKFQFGSLSQEQKSKVIDLFKSLATAGQSLTIRPEFVHELEKQVAEEFGLELDWEAIEVLMAEEDAAEAEAKALAAMGVAVPGSPGGPTMPTPAPAAPAGVLPDIDPGLLPEGFTLTADDEDADDEDAGRLELSAAAAAMLAEAAADLGYVEATRGKPNSGGPKFVRTAEGAALYGLPIGSAITLDVRGKTGKEGIKGKVYGGGTRRAEPNREVFGGGPGAKADIGGVNVDPLNGPSVIRSLTHPDLPGVILLDYGDGTIALRDVSGRLGPRQKFSLRAFLKLGWKISRRNTTVKSAEKGHPKVSVPTSNRPNRPAAPR